MAARETLHSTSNERHLASLSLWTAQLDVYLADLQLQQQSNESNIRRGAAILRVYHLLTVSLVNPSQPRHEEMLTLCENLILGNPDAKMTFTITHDVISPLFLAALTTVDAYIQARAVDLLKLRPGREGVWGQDEAVKILRQLVGMEERPVLRLGGLKQEDDQRRGSKDGNGAWQETDTERNQRIWKDVQAALQGGVVWVSEESPIQEGEIEIGRWEGVDFDPHMGFGETGLGMGMGMHMAGGGSTSASGSRTGSPNVHRGSVTTSPLSGSGGVDGSHAPWSAG